MGSKGSNRQAWARTEGIYQSVAQSSRVVECIVCGKICGTSALSRSSHGKRHVREGLAIARTEFNVHDGTPRTVFEPVPVAVPLPAPPPVLNDSPHDFERPVASPAALVCRRCGAVVLGEDSVGPWLADPCPAAVSG